MFKFGMKQESCGRPIKVDQIKKMLSNKFYVGILKYASEYYDGSHKCFISKQLFNEVQKQVEKILRPRQKGHNFAFSGLMKCGECGAAITAEQHIKKYKNGTSQTFIYYRCTKKLKPCNQKYVSEVDLEPQLKKVVGDCGLHQDWEPYFEKWMAKDEKKDQENSDKELKRLGENQKEIETKLNRLLDGYLDQVVEPEVYKEKKNELFEEKLKITEQIARISKTGSSWLELFFI